MLNHKILSLGGKGTLFVLHGLFGSLDNWQTIAKQFSKFNKIVLIDLRNHGRSPHFNEHNYPVMSNDIYELCQYLQETKISILGHSMGGKVAMTFAQNHSDMVDELIVADISPRSYPPHHQSILKALNVVDFEKVQQRRDIQNMMSEYINHPGIIQFLMKGVGRNGNQNFYWKFNLKVLTEQIEKIGEAQNPSLQFNGSVHFIHGANSDYILEEDKILIERIFPNARFTSIANAGHWLHAEQPEAFIQAMNT